MHSHLASIDCVRAIALGNAADDSVCAHEETRETFLCLGGGTDIELNERYTNVYFETVTTTPRCSQNMSPAVVIEIGRAGQRRKPSYMRRTKMDNA